MIGRLNHVAIAAPDLGAAADVYRGALGADSPPGNFLKRTPSGGVHHLCYEVADILAARDRLTERGLRVLGGGEPQTGAHGKPVLFLHPKDSGGVLIELKEA